MYLRALCGYDLSLDVVHAPLPLERDSRSPPCSVAQSVSSLASRNLLRRQDAADWIPGVLGIRSARTKAPLAILKMDGGNGTVRASQAKESVKFKECVSPRMSPPAQITYCCRKAVIGSGMLKVLAPTPTPPSQVFGGYVHTVPLPWQPPPQNM